MAADSWDPFVRDVLWPQEWALGLWHRYTVSGGRLDLVPAHPLPAVPAARPSDAGGDPRVWRVEFSASGEVPGPVPAGPSSLREVAFPAASLQGLPPALYALRTLLATPDGSGYCRALAVQYEGGRFRVKIEVR